MKPVVPSPIVQLHHPDFENKHIEVFVKREDLIHPEIMGNKWRKLKYNLEAARKLGKKRLVTFGGAYSNHVAATAAAAELFDFESKAIIRGEELNSASNQTLRTAAEKGMSFEFVSREQFRQLKMAYQGLQPEDYLLPEGGTNALAVEGVAELIDEIDVAFDILVTPVGTGGTLAGLLKGLKGKGMVWGFSALKGVFIHDEIEKLCEMNYLTHRNYKLFTDYHFGGYGKINQDLKGFMHTFMQEFGFLLDPVYTGKMFFGVWENVKNNQIAPGTRLLVLHTGGLQGIQEGD
ncbi:MAG: pyridoxal-phosphate dependent enzyme [Cytophagales bacterium]|nr:pyridoxal-phosphate dependent enzyme [Cytophagales bacterium]